MSQSKEKRRKRREMRLIQQEATWLQKAVFAFGKVEDLREKIADLNETEPEPLTLEIEGTEVGLDDVSEALEERAPDLIERRVRPEPPSGFRIEGFLRAYVRMAPLLGIVWLLAAAPPGPGVREAFATAVLSVLVAAAAAKSEGLHRDTSLLRLALHRAPSQSANLLLLLLFLSLAAGVGGTLGGMAAEAADLPVDAVGTVTALLAAFPVLSWYWPLAALAVVVPEEAGRRPGSQWLWWGPGYTSARRLARDFGSVAATAAIVVTSYVWLGLVLAADAYRGEGPFPWVVEAASYALFLPLLAWMCVVEAHRLVRSALGGS